MMNYDIVHSGIARRQNVTLINTAVNQHAIANSVLSAEFTGIVRTTVTVVFRTSRSSIRFRFRPPG